MASKSNVSKSRSARDQTRALDIQIQFMEGVVRRDPRYVEALQLLGDNYTKRGRYSEGLNVDERLAELEPENPLVFYNLACSYAVLGHELAALESLERAVELGFSDGDYMLIDPDLSSVRQLLRFRRLASRLKVAAGATVV